MKTYVLTKDKVVTIPFGPKQLFHGYLVGIGSNTNGKYARWHIHRGNAIQFPDVETAKKYIQNNLQREGKVEIEEIEE